MLDTRSETRAAWFTDLLARAFDRALRAYFGVLSQLGELTWARDAREAQEPGSSSTTAEAFIS